MAKTNPKTNQIKLMPTNKYKGGNGVFMKTNFASPVKTTKKNLLGATISISTKPRYPQFLLLLQHAWISLKGPISRLWLKL